jgi:hypothetical protein
MDHGQVVDPERGRDAAHGIVVALYGRQLALSEPALAFPILRTCHWSLRCCRVRGCGKSKKKGYSGEHTYPWGLHLLGGLERRFAVSSGCGGALFLVI